MNYIHYKLKKMLLNRILVPFWKSRRERWVRRNRIKAELSELYLKDMPFEVPENCVPESNLRSMFSQYGCKARTMLRR